MSLIQPLPHPGAPAGGRRFHSDRRRRPTPHPIVALLSTPGRRRGVRRLEERENVYVDQLAPGVMLWVLAIVLLSTFDAALTLLHIQHGGEELIPTMRWAIDQSPELFVNLKMGMTALGAVLIAMHQNFSLARRAIPFVLTTYLALMGYHLFLVICSW